MPRWGRQCAISNIFVIRCTDLAIFAALYNDDETLFKAIFYLKNSQRNEWWLSNKSCNVVVKEWRMEKGLKKLLKIFINFLLFLKKDIKNYFQKVLRFLRWGIIVIITWNVVFHTLQLLTNIITKEWEVCTLSLFWKWVKACKKYGENWWKEKGTKNHCCIFVLLSSSTRYFCYHKLYEKNR